MAALRNLALRPLTRPLFHGREGARAFSTTNSLSYRREIKDPCNPLSYQPVFWNYEIQDLVTKAKGPWDKFSPEEIKKSKET